MTTPAAGAPAAGAAQSQAQVPGLRGRPEERRRKTKARCQVPGATSSPPTLPGSNMALVVIHCSPLNPPDPCPLTPLERVQGKTGLGQAKGILPVSPQPTLSNTTR